MYIAQTSHQAWDIEPQRPQPLTTEKYDMTESSFLQEVQFKPALHTTNLFKQWVSGTQ